MYAVIEAGGKQYRVELGTTLAVDRMEAEPGSAVIFDRVLLVADGETAAVGRPFLPNASVTAEVLRRERGEKIDVFKYRPKARRRVKKGFRAELTVVRITDLRLDGRSAAEEAERAQEARRTERQRLEEAARRQAEADAALAAQLAERSRQPASGEGGPAPARRSRRTAPKGDQGGPSGEATPGPSAQTGGAGAAPAEGRAPAEGQAPAEGRAPAEGQARAEGQAPAGAGEPNQESRGRRRRTTTNEA
jgi:large subunit ribosomal protein L21